MNFAKYFLIFNAGLVLNVHVIVILLISMKCLSPISFNKNFLFKEVYCKNFRKISLMAKFFTKLSSDSAKESPRKSKKIYKKNEKSFLKFIAIRLIEIYILYKYAWIIRYFEIFFKLVKII